MKNRISIAILALAVAAPACAQQAAPQPDPKTAVYARLLDEANDRVATLAGQIDALNHALADQKTAREKAERDANAAKKAPNSPDALNPSQSRAN